MLIPFMIAAVLLLGSLLVYGTAVQLVVRVAVGLIRGSPGALGFWRSTAVMAIVTAEQRREQFHLARLGESLGALNPHVQGDFRAGRGDFRAGRAYFEPLTGDPARSQGMTLQTLADLRQQQAASLAYFDVLSMATTANLRPPRSGSDRRNRPGPFRRRPARSEELLPTPLAPVRTQTSSWIGSAVWGRIETGRSALSLMKACGSMPMLW